MKKWKLLCGGLATLAGLTPPVGAQDKNAAAAPEKTPVVQAQAAIPGAAAAPAVGAGVAAPAAAPPATLWSFLGCSPAQKAACKERLCATPLGQMLNNTMQPFNFVAGGMLGSLCPPFDPAALAATSPTNAEGTAAKIKASEAGAKKRRAAIRYLGTVDCHWFPDAEKALIFGLRIDTNECVRYEAALALGRGCCCTKDVIAALTESVNGGKKIGPVPECSERVKSAAAAALEHCLAAQPPAPPPQIPDRPPDVLPDRPKDAPARLPNTVTETEMTPEARLVAYHKELEAKPISQLKDDAERALVALKKAPESAPTPAAKVHRDHSLYAILVNARQGGTPAPVMRHEEPVVATTGMMVEEVHTVPPPVATMPVRVTTPAAPVYQISTESAKPAPDMRPRSDNAAQPPLSSTAPVRSPYVIAAQPMPAEQVAPSPSGMFLAHNTSMAVQASYVPRPSTRPMQNDIAIIQEWLPTLSRWDHPELRCAAATHLATLDWHLYPEVVQGLCRGAAKDSALSVRVNCINALAKMHAGSPEVLMTLTKLKSDRDYVIRESASTALLQCKVR